MPTLPAFSIDDVLFGTPQADPPLNGDGGNDLIHGGAGADTLNGGVGADLLYGDRGGDVVNGGSGTDTIVWVNGDGSDSVDGGTGSDTLVVEGRETSDIFSLTTSGGGALFQRTGSGAFQIALDRVETVDVQSLGGNDTFTIGNLSATSVDQVKFTGGNGGETLQAQGTSVPVWADGGAQGDEMTGGSGPDQLFGGAGNDILRGNGGNDWLEGGTGNDVLRGGQGNDVLAGGAGNDSLVGGTGADAYVVQSAGGNDTIQGFSSGSDHIVLQGFSPSLTFTQLSQSITETNGDSVIDLSGFGGGTVTVDNATNLGQNDFVFL